MCVRERERRRRRNGIRGRNMIWVCEEGGRRGRGKKSEARSKRSQSRGRIRLLGAG